MRSRRCERSAPRPSMVIRAGLPLKQQDMQGSGEGQTPGGPQGGERGEEGEGNSETCSWATSHGHVEVLRWTLSNRCDDDEEDFEDISDADFYKWFREYQSKSSNSD